MSTRPQSSTMLPGINRYRILPKLLVTDERGQTWSWTSDMDAMPQCNTGRHAQHSKHPSHPMHCLRLRFLFQQQCCFENLDNLVISLSHWTICRNATSRCAQRLQAVFIDDRDKVMTSILQKTRDPSRGRLAPPPVPAPIIISIKIHETSQTALSLPSPGSIS